jgi:hypothetical protein
MMVETPRVARPLELDRATPAALTGRLAWRQIDIRPETKSAKATGLYRFCGA